MKTKSRLTVGIILISCVLMLTIGITVAYITTKTDPIKNIFQTSKVATTVEESFDKTVKSNVKIKNTGDTKAYIRAMILINYVDSKGNIYSEKPTSSDISMQLNTENWVKGNDGYYYYLNPVNAGSSTEVLINSVSLTSSAKVPTGCYLSVEIVASAIQATPYKAVNQSWSLEAAGINLNR